MMPLNPREDLMAEPSSDSARFAEPSPPAPSRLDVEALARLVDQFRSTLELDEVLENVNGGLRELLEYDTFAVLLLDQLGQELHFRFARGFPESVARNWRFGLGQGLVGTAAATQQTIRVGDVREDPRYIDAAPRVRSEIAVPLVVKGRTIGVLDVASEEPGRFRAEAQWLLEFLAGPLAAAIENARLYANVRQQARTLSVMYEISRELTSILDRERLLQRLAEMVKRLIDYRLFSVMLWNEATQLLEHGLAVGYEAGFTKKGGFPLGYGVTGTVAALRRPMRIANTHLDPHYVSCGHGIEVRSELAVPLVAKDRLIGVLDLESTEYNAFTKEHEQLLSTLSSYVAVALENARLYERVSEGERRLERDLELAREIQKGLLPDGVPPIRGLDAAAINRPAERLGGDFYDFLPYGPERLGFAVGDVAGKGTPAALYASLAVGVLRGHVVEHPCEPAEMLGQMNRQLRSHRLDNRFVAMAFGVYDGPSRRLLLSSAGFPRPFLVRGGQVSELQAGGMPLGLLPDVTHAQLEVDLEPGDVVVFASDGVHEAVDSRHEEFGVRRLRSALAGLASRSAREIAEELLATVERSVHDPETEPDDRTVVVFKVVE
jgi:sigma-B regulation protein RsbU (phosphoserine phosphatase)